MTLGRKPLLYYPPVYPKLNTEVNAVVSHINNPSDFYIQLVSNTHLKKYLCYIFNMLKFGSNASEITKLNFSSSFYFHFVPHSSLHQVENMEPLLLSAKLQDYYNTTTVARENNLSVYCPVIRQAYVARYENSWYRAQVIGEGVSVYACACACHGYKEEHVLLTDGPYQDLC